MNDIGQSWFFQPAPKRSLITENLLTSRVGVLNSNPQTTLDVGGSILSESNIVSYGTIRGSNLIADSNILALGTVIGSNMVSLSNIQAGTLITSPYLVTTSFNMRPIALLSNETNPFHYSIAFNGFPIGLQMPSKEMLYGCNVNNLNWWQEQLQGVDWFFHQERGYAPIHPSWIQDDNNILADLWGLADMGMTIGSLLLDLWQWWNPVGNFTDALAQSLGQMLDVAQASAVAEALQSGLEGGNDESTGSNEKFYVSWSNVKDRPYASPQSTGAGASIGIKGDIIQSEGFEYKTISANHITRQGRQNMSIITTSSCETVFNASRQFWIKDLYLKNSAGCNVGTIASSNKTWTIHDWTFGSNVISNSNNPLSSIMFGTSDNSNYANKIVISGDVQLIDSLSSSNIITDRLISRSNGELYFSNSNLTTKFENTASSNNLAWKTSYLYQSDTSLTYKTQNAAMSNSNVTAPQVTQFAVESNGEAYIRNSIMMSNTATIRTTDWSGFEQGVLSFNDDHIQFQNLTTTVNSNGSNITQCNMRFGVSNGIMQLPSPARIQVVNDLFNDGLIQADPWAFRYYNIDYAAVSNTSNGPVYYTKSNINWSFNSNGMFLLQENKILGKVESSNQFPRIEHSLSNGFIVGTGLQPSLTDYDYFKVTKDGSMFMYDASNAQMTTLFADGAIKRSYLSIRRDGSIWTQSNQRLIENGTFYRQSPNRLNEAEGVRITPSGYVRIGKFEIDPDGTLKMSGKIICSTEPVFDADTVNTPYNKPIFKY